MKKLSFVVLAFTAIAFTSCKDNEKKVEEPEVVTIDNTASEKEVYEISEREAEFNDPKVEAIFDQYIEVQEALVNTDAEKTASESSKLEVLIKEVEVNEATQTAVAAMAATEDVNVQREHFEALTAGIEGMLEGALASGTLYKQYCPMAFNNKGAAWISSGKNILNPYFGDKMLKCGRVDSEIN